MLASGSAQDELPVGAVDHDIGGFAQALQEGVLDLRTFEVLVEGTGEMLDDGAGDAQAQIAPAVLDAVAFVFVSDVEPADEGERLIGDEHFAMIAITPAFL